MSDRDDGLRDAIQDGIVNFHDDEIRNHHGPDLSEERHIEAAVRAWLADSEPSPEQVQAARIAYAETWNSPEDDDRAVAASLRAAARVGAVPRSSPDAKDAR